MKSALVEVRFLQFEFSLNSLVSLFLTLCSVPTFYGKFHMLLFSPPRRHQTLSAPYASVQRDLWSPLSTAVERDPTYRNPHAQDPISLTCPLPLPQYMRHTGNRIPKIEDVTFFSRQMAPKAEVEPLRCYCHGGMNIERVRKNRSSSFEGIDGQIEDTCWLRRADANSSAPVATREKNLSKETTETVPQHYRLCTQGGNDGCINGL